MQVVKFYDFTFFDFGSFDMKNSFISEIAMKTIALIPQKLEGCAVLGQSCKSYTRDTDAPADAI